MGNVGITLHPHLYFSERFLAPLGVISSQLSIDQTPEPLPTFRLK